MMESPRQLHMVIRDLANLPEIEIPEGYELRTYLPGDEQAWADIMNTGIGEWTAEKCRERLITQPQFLPDGLFFVTFQGKPVGSACAWRKSLDEWKVGILHMICVLPEHRSKRLGYVLNLAVLHYLRDHGFGEAWLSTDDFRIPAIKSYLRIGFEPHVFDDLHEKRWQEVFRKIES